MHSRSRSVRRIASPMKKPLLRMLWWRERGALGIAGRAAGELDVDRVVELQLFGELAASAMPLAAAGDIEDIVERAACRRVARRRS